MPFTKQQILNLKAASTLCAFFVCFLFRFICNPMRTFMFTNTYVLFNTLLEKGLFISNTWQLLFFFFFKGL